MFNWSWFPGEDWVLPDLVSRLPAGGFLRLLHSRPARYKDTREFPIVSLLDIFIYGCGSGEFQSFHSRDLDLKFSVGLEVIPPVAVVTGLIGRNHYGVFSVFYIRSGHTVGPVSRLGRLPRISIRKMALADLVG